MSLCIWGHERVEGRPCPTCVTERQARRRAKERTNVHVLAAERTPAEAARVAKLLPRLSAMTPAQLTRHVAALFRRGGHD